MLSGLNFRPQPSEHSTNQNSEYSRIQSFCQRLSQEMGFYWVGLWEIGGYWEGLVRRGRFGAGGIFGLSMGSQVGFLGFTGLFMDSGLFDSTGLVEVGGCQPMLPQDPTLAPDSSVDGLFCLDLSSCRELRAWLICSWLQLAVGIAPRAIFPDSLKTLPFESVLEFILIMQGRITNEYNKNATSVKEFAYLEDRNYPTRQTMEDNHFALDGFGKDPSSGLFAIFDGHGGSQVVEYCAKVTPEIFEKEYSKEKKNIPILFKNVFKKVQDQLRVVGASQSGSTCCVVLLRKADNNRKYCSVANLGDTRAVLANSDGTFKRVSIDHKVSNPSEEERILKSGGSILRKRVAGQLAITRALGDLDLNDEGVICEPDVEEFEVTATTSLLIIASDGLWDVCQDGKAVELVKKLPTTQDMCKTLVDFALKNGSKDNISVLVLKLS